MPPGIHAKLSASASERWLNCPPSVRLSAGIIDKGSTYAAEGTDAHELCEYKLKKALKRDAENPIENLTFYDNEMEESAEGYAQYVMAQIERAKKTCPDPLVLIEQRLDFSRYVPEGFGTGDCVIIADNQIQVIDFKYGKGVPVSATNNPQLKLYALGALSLADGLYDANEIIISIYQPRLSNISEWTTTTEELLNWATEELVPKAKLAFAGEGEQKAGHWCRFCKAKATCRAMAEKAQELAKYDFKNPEQLEDDEIEDALDHIDTLLDWAGALKEYALQAALTQEKTWERYKVVEGRSNRKYDNEQTAIERVKAAGRNPYEIKIKGITAMTKELGGVKAFNELLSDIITKPEGKPVLVPIGDKRPEFIPKNAAEGAKNDFMED